MIACPMTKPPNNTAPNQLGASPVHAPFDIVVGSQGQERQGLCHRRVDIGRVVHRLEPRDGGRT
jgi:hypothetical protein